MPVLLPLDEPADREQVLAAGSDGDVRRSILPGGVRLLTETDPTVRSASIGLWLPVGSRDEGPQHAGSTHVLEHLLFKGTHRRSALDIATAFDEVGGESNAVTAKEHTFYYGRVRSADLPLALDILTDMVTSSTLADDFLETEREVILEELAMAEDDPTDIGYETFLAEVLGADTPLGRPVGGTARSVGALTGQDVRTHYGEHYGPRSLVVTAAGDLDHDELASLLGRQLAAGPWDLEALAMPRARRDRGQGPEGTVSRRAEILAGPTEHLVRPTEQTHIYIGGPSTPASDEQRHTLSVLMAILGGGMSSRLFQHIREDRGLVYSTYSFAGSYSDAGAFGLYAACRPQRADEVTALMIAELDEMAEHGVRDDEMRRALGQITGSMALGLEDTSSRMGRLGTAELVHGRYSTVDETIARIAAVRAEDIQALARTLAGSLTTRVDVGPAA